MGVAYCHMNGIVHRNIKPSKILIGSAQGKEVMKISSFDTSRCLSATDHDETAGMFNRAYSCLK